MSGSDHCRAENPTSVEEEGTPQPPLEEVANEQEDLDTNTENSQTSLPGDLNDTSKPTEPLYPVSEEDSLNGIFERQAKAVARNPRLYLRTSLLVSVVLSVVGMVAGKFTIEATTIGWTTRGTMIADRQTQSMLVRDNADYLRWGGEPAWEDVTSNLQPSWEVGDDDDRRLSEVDATVVAQDSAPGSGLVDLLANVDRRGLPFRMFNMQQRRLRQTQSLSDELAMYASEDFWYYSRLWPVWKPRDPSVSLLEPEALYDICVAEENTQQVLEKNNLCWGVSDKCLRPFSIVFYARFVVPGGMGMTCSELRDTWLPFKETTEQEWKACVADVKSQTLGGPNADLPSSCPFLFSPHMVNADFDETLKVSYSSSVFVSGNELWYELYDQVAKYDRGGKVVEGVYDTQFEDFNYIYQDEALVQDTLLALGSAAVVIVAIMTHTRSPFITIVGLAQILLSFPLAYFIYRIVAQLTFFPFLNFIGIFVVFAVGADDVFVAVDKWKNARLEHPDGSIELIAALALPDAAGAMFLTTLTTSVAFFATAICLVAPIRMFAIFVGVLIMIDYILCVLLVFPALCIYDNAVQSSDGMPSRFMLFRWARESPQLDNEGEVANNVEGDEVEMTNIEEGEDRPSLIRRILYGYYSGLHKFNWALLLVGLSCLGVSAYYATTMELPLSLDVRLLDNSNEYEQNYEQRKNILYDVLKSSAGSTAYVLWGVQPADTGDQNDPNSYSRMVLDNTFEPSGESSQTFLMNFCDSMFELDFANAISEDYVCPMTKFDTWLGEQQLEQYPSGGYTEYCGNATEIPIAEEDFHDCFSTWAEETEEEYVLTRNGVATILFLPFRSRVGYNDHYRDLKREFWLIEDWVTGQMDIAPSGVEKGYFVGSDFWWYDTHKAMLETAYGSAAIALGASALVILFSSRSITLTIFSSLTILYVLASVTATMVAFGWNLGFLESICFAILVGVSADFVTHFSHAYAAPKGQVDRGTRTQRALVYMGPSILAAAFTTAAAAVIMIFTVILFFRKFAYVLFFTIVQSTVGAFIVFCSMTDTLGPSDPQQLINRMIKFIRRKAGCDDQEKAEHSKDQAAGESGED